MRRLRLPNISIRLNKKAKKILVGIAIIVLVIFLVNRLTKIMRPILISLCEVKAESIATKINNEVVIDKMKNVKYEDLINCTKDEQGNVTMLSANIVKMNELSSQIAVIIQEKLNTIDPTSLKIPLRKLNW